MLRCITCLCFVPSIISSRGYNARYKAQTGNAAQHATGNAEYYCESKLWNGAVATTYSISIKQMPDYRLYDDTNNQFVNVSAPEQKH